MLRDRTFDDLQKASQNQLHGYILWAYWGSALSREANQEPAAKLIQAMQEHLVDAIRDLNKNKLPLHRSLRAL